MIKIIWEDDNLMVISKPVGVVVHEGAGLPAIAALRRWQAGETGPTLVDWFLKKYPQIKKLPWPDTSRPGIVHRLDKDTAGLMLLAKNPQVLSQLQTQFKKRKIEKAYLALVAGKVEPKQGKIDAAIGRHPQRRRQMTVRYLSSPASKPSTTTYKVLEYKQYDKTPLTLLELKPLTGRMHQLRVHLKHLGYPILGDAIYNSKLSRKISKTLKIEHQMLVAWKLVFRHPKTYKKQVFQLSEPLWLKYL